jgi:undecaprenyl-diphosphatase
VESTARGAATCYERRPTLLFWLLVGLLVAFHVWFIGSGRLDLAPDEAYYWTWSKRLDWGYYSKGPMVAYLIALSTRLGGDSEFFVRLPAVLLSAGTAVLTFRLARDLSGSAQVGLDAVLLLAVMPLTSAGSILMTIDAPLMFFWVLALFATYRSLEAKSRAHWTLAGVALGLGLLSKLTMAMIIPQAGAYVALSRRDGRSPPGLGPYLALAAGGALFLPVLWWNWAHDWLSFRHVLGQVGPTGGWPPSLASLGRFLGSQAAVATPVLFLLLLIGMWHIARAGLGRARNDAALFLFCASVPLLLLCATVSLWTKVQANWAAPAYIAGAIAASVWRRQSSSLPVPPGRARRARVLFTVSLATALLVTTVGHFPGTLARLGVPFPSRLDPTRALTGWRELGRRVGDIYLEMRISRPTFVFSDRYQVASELMFYVPGHPRAFNIALERRMNQFDVWDGTADVIGWDAIFVTATFDEPPIEVIRSFDRVERRPANGDAPQADRYAADTWSIFRCYGFKGFPPPQFDGY